MCPEPARIPDPVGFGDDFELDVRSYELRRSGQALKLERIPMELLVLLVERRGELVTRDQIAERIWGKDVFLDTDNSINAAIRKIRQVLKDDSERPRFVLTVTGKGYRFVAPLQLIAAPVPIPPASTSSQNPESLLGRKISHYRIVQLLGGGGMGLVYKAEDLKLGRQIALKLLPGELASDTTAFERLQQEARAASLLDHPNICSVYHLGEHEGQPFIAMQLLEGQTLREWITKAASLDTKSRLKQLLEFAIQILDGLQAAHEKGVIHRDIKPANIFITSRGQAKILDFGVAKFVDSAEVATKEQSLTESKPEPANPPASTFLTRSGVSIGTPSYLSPEQIRREKLDARSDLFSFGLVLYEMATGERAFSGNTVTEIRDAVLNMPAAKVRQLNPEFPVQLETIVGRSLEKNRDSRYQSARKLQSDLMRLREGAGIRPPVIRVAWWAALGAIFILAILLGTNLGRIRDALRKNPTEPAAAEYKPRPSLAVLGFKNLSGQEDEAWISSALSEMLSAEMAAGQQLRVLPSEDVARMKIDLSLPPADTYSRDTLAKIRDHLHSDVVVLGSYLAAGKGAAGRIRIDLQLQDTRDGESIAVVSREGRESDLAELITQGGTSLRQKLGIGDVSANDAPQVRAAVPQDFEAARLYAQGLAKLQKFDALGARELLKEAIAADSRHALSHSALAQAWWSLGYNIKAQDEAKKAFELSGSLSREERLEVEGRYREYSHDYARAIEIYRTLYNFFPDRLDYGLHLASVQVTATQSKDALATIKRIRSSPQPGASDVDVDLTEARAQQNLGEFKSEQNLAAAGAEKARSQGSPMYMAAARLSEGWVWDHLGEYDKAIAALTESRQLATGRNPSSAAWAELYLGHVFYDKGEFEAARKAYQQAFDEYQSMGDLQGVSHCLEGLGNTAYEQHRLEDAKRNYQEQLRIAHELGAKLSIATASGNLANLLEEMGDLPGAAAADEQSVQEFRDLGNGQNEAISFSNWAGVLVELGDLESAKKRVAEAISLQDKSGYKRGKGFSLFTMAELDRLQDRLEDARKTAEQGLALRKLLGDESNAIKSQIQLAQIALEQQRFDDAVVLAKTAAASSNAQKNAEDEALAGSILAAALLSQSKVKEAQTALEPAIAIASKGVARPTHFAIAITAAEVAIGSGKPAGARKQLESVLADARRYRYAEPEFEARLRLGELDLRSGSAAAARSRLQQLQEDARKKGFLLIARKAKLAIGVHGA